MKYEIGIKLDLTIQESTLRSFEENDMDLWMFIIP